MTAILSAKHQKTRADIVTHNKLLTEQNWSVHQLYNSFNSSPNAATMNSLLYRMEHFRSIQYGELITCISYSLSSHKVCP